MPRKKIVRQLAVIDLETDPFLFGRLPKPFAAGFYCDEKYVEFWGDTCIIDLVNFLKDSEQKYIIYAHNGGKFDYFFILDHLENPIKIIGSRIAKAYLSGHELRDSYSILPIPLAAYNKDTIDYKLFEKNKREKHKQRILDYLKSDCKYTFDLVEKFIVRFGNKLTVGGAAINELEKYHPFDKQGQSHDEVFRPFYFGGRVECFETGVLNGDFTIYDVNSMYPHVMSEYFHPTGNKYSAMIRPAFKNGVITGCQNLPFYFVELECDNLGAFPTREENRPLNFNVPHGIFSVTSHEFKIALKHNLISNIKILRVWVPDAVVKFNDFVSIFSAEKIAAKKSGDKTSEIFSKLILNSAYGKFGSNPEKYKNYLIQSPHDVDFKIDLEQWTLSMRHNSGVVVWEQPTKVKRYFDVATAASITGAARAVLLAAIMAAQRPIYCDTDSIICEKLDLPISDFKLGAWKIDGELDSIAVVRKKLYAGRKNGVDIKKASKGAILSHSEIYAVAHGKKVKWQKDAPSYSLTMGERFIDREIS